MPPRPNPLAINWTTVDGLRVFARVSTAGAGPIVLLHGFGVSGRYLAPAAAILARRHPVYVPDLPGSGRSGNPAAALTIAQLADFLADWMNAQNLPRATLLGNSFGCQIIVAFALRHPGRIDRAVLVGPTVDPAARSPLRLGMWLLRDVVRERPSLVAIALRDYARFGAPRGTATLGFMIDDPIETKLPLVTAPALVVRGERDAIVSQAWAETVAALLPNGQLTVIPGAAHAVNYDAPAALAAAIEDFLSERSAVTAGMTARRPG